jgi:hypothetical protein
MEHAIDPVPFFLNVRIAHFRAYFRSTWRFTEARPSVHHID